MKKSLLVSLPVAAFVAGMAVVPSVFAEPKCDAIDQDGWKDALTQCENITLASNIELADTYATINKTLTINLGGHNITKQSGNGTVLYVTTDGNLTLTGQGTVTSKANGTGSNSATVWVDNNATLTVNGGATVQSTDNGYALAANPGTINIGDGAVIENTGGNGSGISINGQSSKLNITGGNINTKGSSVNVFGNTPEVKISGGTINSTNGFALTGNGSETTDSSITISGNASLTSKNNAAVYNPQSGTLTVNGGTITGSTGILARQGTVDINGGTIVANGSADGTITGTTTPADGYNQGIAVITDGEDVTATIDGDNTTISSTGAPVSALNSETPGDQITIGAGVKIESPVTPDSAYLGNLVVGPNGVVMTAAEAAQMEADLANQNANNPNTTDSIALYITIAAIALLGLGATALIAKKANR